MTACLGRHARDDGAFDHSSGFVRRAQDGPEAFSSKPARSASDSEDGTKVDRVKVFAREERGSDHMTFGPPLLRQPGGHLRNLETPGLLKASPRFHQAPSAPNLNAAPRLQELL